MNAPHAEPPPGIVRLGVLTPSEWAAIEPGLRADLDAETERYLARYGERHFADVAEHRANLSFLFGVC
jgi:hypothetical protein